MACFLSSVIAIIGSAINILTESVEIPATFGVSPELIHCTLAFWTELARCLTPPCEVEVLGLLQMSEEALEEEFLDFSLAQLSVQLGVPANVGQAL
jgi:hypothetical protein